MGARNDVRIDCTYRRALLPSLFARPFAVEEKDRGFANETVFILRAAKRELTSDDGRATPLPPRAPRRRSGPSTAAFAC